MATRTETITVSKTTYIDSFNSTTKFGSNIEMQCGWHGGGSVAALRSLLSFALPSLNSGEVIAAATLQLNTRVAASQGAAAQWVRCTKNTLAFPPAGWTQAATTWMKYTIVKSWDTPGGDFDLSTGTVSFTLPFATGIVQYTGFKALVDDAYANRNAELNIIGMRTVEGTFDDECAFSSVNDTSANQPKIILNITDKFVYNQPRGIGRGIVRGVL